MNVLPPSSVSNNKRCKQIASRAWRHIPEDTSLHQFRSLYCVLEFKLVCFNIMNHFIPVLWSVLNPWKRISKYIFSYVKVKEEHTKYFVVRGPVQWSYIEKNLFLGINLSISEFQTLDWKSSSWQVTSAMTSHLWRESNPCLFVADSAVRCSTHAVWITYSTIF
jgi:hypothetical protein